MTFKYFFRRLKKNLWFTLAGAGALLLVIMTLIMSFAMEGIIYTVYENYTRTPFGTADLIVKNSEETSDRFFYINDLRYDAVIKENVDYLGGYFETFALVEQTNGVDDICTLYAVDCGNNNNMNSDTYSQIYMPIAAQDKPDRLDTNEIIIGRAYADAENISVGAWLNLKFGNLTKMFRVAAISENSGLFFSESAVVISSQAWLMFSGMFSTNIVTHCIIKAKDAAAQDAITSRINENFGRLSVRPVVIEENIKNDTMNITIPVNLITAIVFVFCILALMVLLYLIFSRDQENFKLLSCLGMSKTQIRNIGILTCLFMCIIAVGLSVIAMQPIMHLIRGTSVLFNNVTVSPWAYVFGIGIGIIVSIVCGIKSTGERKEKVKKTKQTKINPAANGKNIREILVGISSFAFMLAALILIDKVPYAGLAFAVLAIAGTVMLLPKLVRYLYAGTHKISQSMLSLWTKTYSRSKDWYKFVVFITVGLITILTIVLTYSDVQSNTPAKMAEMSLPFDIIATEIKPDSERDMDTIYNDISGVKHVDKVIKSEFYLNAGMTAADDLVFYGSLVGLEKDGFPYFNANYEDTAELDGSGAVVGRALASRANLRRGDDVTFEKDGTKINFTITEIIDSQYLGNQFVLVDLAALASEERPYNEILVATDWPTDVVNDLNDISNGTMMIFEIGQLIKFLSGAGFDMLWLVNAFCVAIVFLAFMTVLLMIVMRNVSSMGEIKQLSPLGLTPGMRLKHNFFAVIFIILPVLLLLPLQLLLLTKCSFAVFYFSGRSMILPFSLALIVISIAACFAAVLAAEFLLCKLFTTKKRFT